MIAHRQPSFVSGELAPTLWGRVDLDRYASGARSVENFFVSKHGALVSRPGMVFRGDLGEPCRLLPFLVEAGKHRLLAISTTSVRVYLNGNLVQTIPIPSDMEITAANLPLLRVAQSGDVLVVVSPDFDCRELVRTPSPIPASDAWAWRLPQGPAAYGYHGERSPALYAPFANAFGRQDDDGNYPAKAQKWQWVVTSVVQRADGTLVESRPVRVNSYWPFWHQGGALWRIYLPTGRTAYDGWAICDADHPVVVEVQTPRTPDEPEADVYSTKFYRGRDGVYGFVGEVLGPQVRPASHPEIGVIDPELAFVDYGKDPDYKRQPPKATRPPVRSFTVAYFNQRLTFGGTPARPTTVHFSATDDHWNFDLFVPSKDTDAGDTELASRQRERIRAMLGLDDLLVFTDRGVWSVTGLSGEQPGEIHLQNEVGAAAIEPIVVDNEILYVAEKGNRVVALGYSNERQGYGVRDLTVIASHLLAGHRIVSWCHAPDPWGLIWCVRDDGVLLSLTYQAEHGVCAWARHTTAGAVEAVASVPEGDEDAVYLVVRRTIDGQQRRYLERLATRRVETASAHTGLDAAVIRSLAGTPGATSVTIGGLSHLEGLEVRALVDGVVTEATGPVAGGAATFPTTDSFWTRAVIGLPYVCRLETLDLPAGKDRPRIVQEAIWEVEASRGLWTGAGPGLWAGDSATALTESRERIVADGFGAMALHTDTVSVSIASRWGEHGRVVLEQRDPLPLTILGLTRRGQ